MGWCWPPWPPGWAALLVAPRPRPSNPSSLKGRARRHDDHDYSSRQWWRVDHGPAGSSGTKIGPASDVPVGGSASFQDPSSGDPALVIQAKSGQFVAFDAVCPHAGCTVEYSSSQDVIVCPCHGSLFNASSGAVEQGPAASNLRPIPVKEGSDGDLYVT